MAFLATTTPPTGIVPAEPVGHASGIIAPSTKVGVFINTCIVSHGASFYLVLLTVAIDRTAVEQFHFSGFVEISISQAKDNVISLKHNTP